MEKLIRIENIFGGKAPSQYFQSEGQYSFGVGIDPDLPISDAVGDREISGVLRPSGYASLTNTNINANPYWILTTPKDALVYTVLNNGRLISYSSSFGSEALVDTAPTSSGNGAKYYNNYIYVAANTDISRYGPLDGTPTMTDTVWTGATLGSQTALVNTTYPSIRGSGVMPNHVMHAHTDNKLFVCDYDSTSSTAANRGRGLIHFIRTTFSTTEGTGNDDSTYNTLDLPIGYMPTCLESYGNLLVIGAIPAGSNATLMQGKAALFFWDTLSPSFSQVVFLPDPLVTALKNVNGRLYVFTGAVSSGSDVSNGYRVSVYVGGNRIEQVYFSNTGSPPLAGAVDSFGDRVVWGTFEQLPTTTGASPNYYGVVMAYGSKDNRFPTGVHGIINTKAAGTAADGLVTSVANVQQSSFSYPKFAVGWRDANNTKIDTQSTTYGTSVWRSALYRINKPFVIKAIRFGLGAAVAANHTITPTLYLDDYSSSSTSGLTVVNNTNYASSERFIEYRPAISAKSNFVLEFSWTGTALLPILLPIEILIQTDER